MTFQKKTKADWDAEALAKDLESHSNTFAMYGKLVTQEGSGDFGAIMLLASELRMLRQEMRWINQALKKLVNGQPVQTGRGDDINF